MKSINRERNYVDMISTIIIVLLVCVCLILLFVFLFIALSSKVFYIFYKEFVNKKCAHNNNIDSHHKRIKIVSEFLLTRFYVTKKVIGYRDCGSRD